jgi:hypothetical protein
MEVWRQNRFWRCKAIPFGKEKHSIKIILTTAVKAQIS